MQGSAKNQLDKYQKLDKLGEGTYGLVYKAKNQETGEVSHYFRIPYLWSRIIRSRFLGEFGSLKDSIIPSFIYFLNKI